MTINRPRIQHCVQTFDFQPLFIEELGWDNDRSRPFSITMSDTTYTLQPIAQKRGLVVYRCSPDTQSNLPDAALRSRIEKEVAKTVYEHILIFTDEQQQTQVWQWVKREQGRPTACRETTYHSGQSGETIIQKLSAIAFDLSEEEQLFTSQAARRVRSAFDVDRVTKRFYDSFKLEKDTFATYIEGIPVQEDREWYTSIMLNRLMFVYFIQKKGFLDGDTNYLPNRLQQVKERNGTDTFFSFYRAFLLRLFHKGLAERERSREIDTLLGNVPYLNGSLFDIHELERKNAHIQIVDTAFERLFAFFDKYQWHLDDRRVKNDNEINPDVLGYIFEKYINQKQMGAYYTKEDITEYISKSTIIPYLFDAAAQKMPIAFEPDRHTTVWQLLQNAPDRYFYDAVKKGVTIELPPEIAAGLHDVSRRGAWNRPAPEEYALPTETWRELVARRNRYTEIRTKLEAGEVASINDLITYNLNIRQFAEDVIHTCEDPHLLRAFYESIAGRMTEQMHEKLEPGITVLDPTCGSGAFLFAALNTLQPLYEACLDRMQSMVEDVERLNALDEQRGRKTMLTQHSQLKDFRAILLQVEQHPNRDYFILKSIIVNNLYGVDIMEEATEICKLRLFLKLATQVERDPTRDNMSLEPLPDIDFNIRSGNTLVGFATLAEVKQAVGKDMRSLLTSEETIQRIEQKALAVKHDFENFRKMQTQLKVNPQDIATIKKQVRTTLQDLETELDRYLASEYGIDASNIKDEQEYQQKFAHWQHTHQPFHWFVEFYGIINKGGFDVIIGNPPYVEYSKVRNTYTLMPSLYTTELCGNIYAFILERSLLLLHAEGRQGMIVPISLVCTQRMRTLQDSMLASSTHSWHSNYAERPAKLFVGAEVLLTISLLHKGLATIGSHWITGLRKWSATERAYLFNNTVYERMSGQIRLCILPKISSNLESSIIDKISQSRKTLGYFLQANTPHKIYYRIGGGRYWKIFTTFQPRFVLNGQVSVSSRENYLFFATSEQRELAVAVLSSTLFYWYFILTTNGRDLNPSDLKDFPLSLIDIKKEHNQQLLALSVQLMHDYRLNKQEKKKVSGLTGDILYEEFYPRLSKPIIDEIDRMLAQHYGFTDEELDFITNYDIKYRMGRDGGEDEGE
ncbi:MAG TPA: DNA methyltransferase [Ktedonobacteraceae bacterium]|nr:DNA methyltransferase [Ktedonobacteraceae bacterium]